MRTQIQLFVALFLSFGLMAQNVLIFQPSGGANDGADEGGLLTGKDTWVNRYAPNDNYGDMYINLGSPRSNCNTSDYKSYYQFDLTSLPEVVDSVFFGLTHLAHDTYCYSNCNADFYFYYCTSAWNEMTLVQSNLPTENSSPFYGPIPISFPNDYGNVEYEFTNAYTYWKSNTNDNFGFTIYSPTVGCNNAAVIFNVYGSDDSIASNRPYLKIYYPSQAGIDESKLQLAAYPNPFTDFIQVDLIGIDNYYLTDMTGRKINVVYNVSTKRFQTAHLAKGLYFLYVENDGKVTVKKLLKN